MSWWMQPHSVGTGGTGTETRVGFAVRNEGTHSLEQHNAVVSKVNACLALSQEWQTWSFCSPAMSATRKCMLNWRMLIWTGTWATPITGMSSGPTPISVFVVNGWSGRGDLGESIALKQRKHTLPCPTVQNSTHFFMWPRPEQLWGESI